MEPHDVTHFETSEAFRAWMEEHHEARDVLWVGFWKKATDRPSITWEESVDVALCFGWIDGLRKRVDDEAYTIRFTPRRDGSVWSRRNIERYRALEAEERVAPAGEAAYAQRTEERSGVYSFERKKPPELSSAFEARLKADEVAWASWQSRPPGYRKRASHWVMSAKKEGTRERRFKRLLEDEAAQRKVEPLRRKR
ncbi:MAG: YdeI/OmpD-associated family protein [Longimicrobiales bacterium]|nr:YdeI/OmpD-associated family protein [Longimicrobiales bacterium]